jgi:TolB-like protein/Tfp pilus assembly protein PilF
MKKLFIPALVVVALAIIAVAIWRPWSQKETVPIPSDKPSIAVLPFEDLSPQKDQEYFCDGLAEELINRLINIENLRVPARTSAFSFKGKDKDIREIGEKLNVEMVLDGSVRKAGNKLRITAQLVKAADGYPVWSKIYERNIEDTFALQDEISLAIIDNLKVKLLKEGQLKLTKRYTENIEAYDLYLKGRFFWNKRTEDGLKKAIEYFEQAIEVDANYALAYAGIADSYNLLAIYSYIQPHEAYPVAKKAAQKAMEIDETISEAHTSLASVLRYYDWNWEEAEKEFKRAFELNPNNVTSHHWYALYLIIFGRFDEAIREMKRAQELDPLSLIINTDLGLTFCYARQYDLAEKQCLKTLEIDPNFWKTYRILGQIYIQKEMFKEAIAEFNKSIKLNYSQGAHALMGYVWGMLNRRDQALRILDELHKQSKIKYVSNVYIAILYISLARKDEALELLEKAYEEHDPGLTFIRVNPIYDTLRSDPRFKELIKKIGLEK